jgi:aquaporin Z
MEGAELAVFMLAACLCTALLFYPASPAIPLLPDATLRRFILGLGMGGTAVGIILCPWGKRSGAHFNPSITLSYLLLGKIHRVDATGYILGQFAGGLAGVIASALLLGHTVIASTSVNYVVTVPGIGGWPAAFVAELFMSAVLMSVVLHLSNHPRLAVLTPYIVGALISLYVLLFAPVSGFSLNPARTLGSAIPAHTYTALWIYFTAPLLGMFSSALLYRHSFGPSRIHCAKLRHDPRFPCPFFCQLQPTDLPAATLNHQH